MFIKRTLLTLMTLFMAVSGMPVYAEKAPAPEVTEQKDDAQASAEMESVLGIKKLYAEEPSMLATGKEFNAAIKTLAAGTSKAYNTTDSLIQSVQVVDTRPSGSITIKDVSANNDGSYLAWWDAGTHTIKLYSESGDVILNPDSGSMFSGCSNLTTLDVSGWNTSQVTNMRSMFNGCSKLITLDVSGWDTSRVTNMYSMFQDCSSLTTLDVSKWNTSLVTNMGSIFGGCRSLTTLDVSGWGTSQVTNMGWMFKNCASLKTLDVSNWSTGKVTSMDSMFSRCNSLTTLDVSNWNTSKVTGMNNMFYNCSNLTTLDLSGWDTSQVTDMGYMFYKCSKLTTIYIGSNWSTSNVTSSSGMFNNCTKLPNFDASAIDKTHANALPDGYLLMKNPNLRYLAKSSFVLSGTSDYGTAVNTIVMSDKNGRMSFKNLEKGTYTLTEVSPTDGYIKNSVKYTVTVTDSGVSVVPDNADYYYETADQKVLFNEPYHAFTIQKTSSTDSTIGVAGAEFLLSGVSDYGTEVSQTRTTGSTGIATFDHLEAGNYLLTETKAPEHYALDPIPRVVSINKYGVVKIDGLSKEGSSFLWTDIRNADGTITITKKWNDTLTGTNASGRALPSIVISTQRTIPDAVTVTYDAKDGYFGTDQTNQTNVVHYSEAVDQNGNILSVDISKGQEMTPSISGKVFDAWYLDSALTKKAPDAIADYIKANPDVRTIILYAKYKVPPMLTTGREFNAAIKTLAAGTSKTYNAWDSLIQSVQVVDIRPSDSITTKDVSADQDGAYLAWWDAETSTIKLYSESGDVILNPDSSSMFFRCSKLTTLDVSGWDTSQVTSMGGMFWSCSNLTTLDLSNWNTSQVTNMGWMFSNCSKLTALDVSGWNTSKVMDMGGMFYGCGSLATLDVSKWDTSKVTSMDGMFAYCSKLTTLDVSTWDTSKVTKMGSMFSWCSSLTALNASNWNTNKVTDMSSMFSWCSSLTTLGVSNWNTDKVTDMNSMFSWCSSLTTLDLSTWNTGKVANMGSMFSWCSNLTTLDVSNWNTSQVTNMNGMFYGCSKLTTLDVSGWNTSRVTNMGGMFWSCSSLTTLNVSGFDTSQVTDMYQMFSGCTSLTTLDVSNWDTGKVTNMSSMFYNCSSLTTLDVSKWDTGKVTGMNSMFSWCSSLTTLDLSTWNTSQVTNMGWMFCNCSKLITIYIGSNWNTDKVTSSGSMFYNCTKLPHFNSSVVDKTNAHAGAGGYMTLKS